MNNLLTATLIYLVQLFGGSLGCAIIALSLAIRFTLLPLTIKLARRSRRNQEMMCVLKPEMDELKKRFAKNPECLFDETGKLYRKHNFTPFDLPTLVGGFIQWPIFGMLYSAIRKAFTANSAFLWIRNLALPNPLLTVAILLLTAISAYLMPTASDDARATMIVVQIIVTSLIVWKLAAGLGLYWAASGLVNLFQTLWLRHRVPQEAKLA
jgi:YidC/Oxa1 family membrane protein insertase